MHKHIISKSTFTPKSRTLHSNNCGIDQNNNKKQHKIEFSAYESNCMKFDLVVIDLGISPDKFLKARVTYSE